MRPLELLMMLGLLLAPLRASAGNSPAAELCDGLQDATLPKQAERVIRFSQAVFEETDRLSTGDQSCVLSHLPALEPSLKSYCDARAAVGHDLALKPLQEFSHELASVETNCFLERTDRELALMKEARPKTCAEMPSAFSAAVDLANAGEEPLDARVVACIAANMDQVANPLVESCLQNKLSLEAAYVELSSRLEGICAGEHRSPKRPE